MKATSVAQPKVQTGCEEEKVIKTFMRLQLEFIVQTVCDEVEYLIIKKIALIRYMICFIYVIVFTNVQNFSLLN